MTKSTELVYLILLLIGTLSSTATAQTIESETNTLPATADPTFTSNLQTTAEVDHQVEADLPDREIEPLTTLTPPDTNPNSGSTPEIAQVPSPKTLAELDLPPRTVKEAGLFSQEVNPQIAPTPAIAQEQPLQFTPRVGGQFTTGAGVGYENSFGAIEAFVPLRQTPRQNLTFLEGRLLISTDEARLGGNVVVGHRLYNATNDRTFGGYVAYDIRDTGDSVFNQLGGGIETLGENWDARINGYLPIGDNRQQVAETISDRASVSNPVFQGNFLALTLQQQQQVNRRFEVAMAGFDAEAGIKILPLGATGQLRGFAGLYYYDPPNRASFFGGRARLEARPNDNLRVGLTLQGDENFGTTVVLSVGANFPGTRPRGIRPEDRVLARLGESVVRQQNIVVDEQIESELFTTPASTVLVTNPTTGQPWTFRHVNLGIGTGDGTVESPTGTVAEALAAATSNNIVYVQSGTNPGIPAFSIPDGVQVLSTEPVQQIDTVEAGTIQLAGSDSGVLPRVTGTVTLGSNTTLSGFEITGVEGSAVVGTNINTVAIRNNVISNSTTTDPSNFGQGILLSNVTGKIDITNNILRENDDTAISINSDAGQIELTLDNNAIADNFNAIRLQLSGTTQGTTQITNNSITSSGSIDIQLAESTQLSNLTLSNNTIDNPASEGMNVQTFDDAQATILVSNNTLRNITGDGTFTGDGMNFAFNQDSRLQLTIDRNTINTASDDGIDLNLFDNAVATVTISNNQISNTNSEGIGTNNIGIEVDADDNSQLRLLIESNRITGSSDQGISIFTGALGGSPQVFTTIRLNTLTGNNVGNAATGGFDAQTSDTSKMCLQLQDNTSDRFELINNSGTFQVEVGTNAGTVNQVGTTVAPPFVDCTVP